MRISIAAGWRMACGLPGIASGVGDPTLPHDGTDFITLQVVMRMRVWLRLCCATSRRWIREKSTHHGDAKHAKIAQVVESMAPLEGA